MSTLDTLLERNHEFAAHRFVAGLPMCPSLRTLIISCADPRVDPVHLLGLEPGEAVVLRNGAGGVAAGTLRLLSLLLRVSTRGSTPSAGGAAGTDTSRPLSPIGVHHT